MGRCLQRRIFPAGVLWLVVFFFVLPAAAGTFPVKGSPNLYGDEPEVSWEQIAPLLPAPYNKNKFVTVQTLNGSKTFYFNTEMFLDRGFLVYGDPYSTAALGYPNDFREKENGYFSAQGKRGEYRYLGLTFIGTVYTNAVFPSDAGSCAGIRLKMIRYTDLPDNLKTAYGIGKTGNSAFAGARRLIDAADSPCLEFTNTSGMWGTITLRQSLALTGAGVRSVYEYGYINGWGAGGGSIRFFYQGIDDPGIIRYATFTGPVDVAWQKRFEGLAGEIKTYDGAVTADVFTLRPGETHVSVDAVIHGIFTDAYASLQESERLFTYTRNDGPSYALRLSEALPVAEVRQEPNSVAFLSSRRTLRFDRENLQPGLNTVKLKGAVRVAFGSAVFSRETEKTIYIRVVTDSVSVTPSPPPVATPTPVPVPTGQPKIQIRRKW